MIVLDANVLIAYLDARDQHHDAAEQLLLRSADDEFGADALTVAEVLVGPLRASHLDVARAALDELEVRELAFPVDTAVPLARLRAMTGLRMPDCCLLLAAEVHDVRVVSFDARLVRAAEHHGLQVSASLIRSGPPGTPADRGSVRLGPCRRPDHLSTKTRRRPAPCSPISAPP